MDRYDIAMAENEKKDKNPPDKEIPAKIPIQPMEIELRLDPSTCMWSIQIKTEGNKWEYLRQETVQGIMRTLTVREFSTRMEAEDFCKNIGLVI